MVGALYPEVHNTLSLSSGNNGTTQTRSSAVITSNGSHSVQANGPEIQMTRFSMGHTFAPTIPYPGFESDAMEEIQEILYPPYPISDPEIVANGSAALRYKEALFNTDGNRVSLTNRTMDSLFTVSDRESVRAALKIFRNTLAYTPYHSELRHMWLEVYYDWIIAEQLLADEKLLELSRIRLEADAQDRLIIDQEVDLYEEILGIYEQIWLIYSGLLSDTANLDPEIAQAGTPPGFQFGARVFKEEQPVRNHMTSHFWEDGIRKTISSQGAIVADEPQTLFNGYKDYVALFKLMRKYVQATAQAAKLLVVRGQVTAEQNDFERAAQLMSHAEIEVTSSLSLLKSLVPEALENASETSGLAEAGEGIVVAMGEFDVIAGSMRGSQNALGFDPDTFVLFSSPPGQPQVQDSFDALMQWLDPNRNDSVLGIASSEYQNAISDYQNYRIYSDEISAESAAILQTYGNRYQEITGYTPDEQVDDWDTELAEILGVNSETELPTHYTNPRNGSELWEAYQLMGQADLQQETLSELNPLINTQVNAAREALAEAELFTDQVDEATENYRDEIRRQRDIITGWNSAQAGMQVTYDMTSDIAGIWAQDSVLDFFVAAGLGTAAVAVVGAANLAIQTAGEAEKGKAEEELDLAAASFDRDLAMAGVNEGALAASREIRTLERERISAALEMQEILFQRKNQHGRISALRRELAQLDLNRIGSSEELSRRYIADPIHFNRARNSLIRADLSFQAAQRWMFLGLQALEYKYNQPFSFPPKNEFWTVNSIFNVRNYRELQDLQNAMNEYNLRNSTRWPGDPINALDTISLKDDV